VFFGLDTRASLKRVFILGGKQVGIRIAQLLEQQGVTVKLFERDEARAEKIATILQSAIVLNADGTDQRFLEEEGLDEADAFLALTNDDEDNIIASLLARRVGVKKVVALINRLNYLPMAQRLGMNTTVSPRLAAVDRILQFVRKGGCFRSRRSARRRPRRSSWSPRRGRPTSASRCGMSNFRAGAIVGAIVRPSGVKPSCRAATSASRAATA
jgi:trk system potassium uptake protein